MCYMTATAPAASSLPVPIGRVGVRELRQNLSVSLERVVAGESLEVTDRGRAVAMFVPLRPGATLVGRLKGGDPFIFGRGGEDEAADAGFQQPALIVVGEVVRLRDKLQRFEQTRGDRPPVTRRQAGPPSIEGAACAAALSCRCPGGSRSPRREGPVHGRSGRSIRCGRDRRRHCCWCRRQTSPQTAWRA